MTPTPLSLEHIIRPAAQESNNAPVLFMLHGYGSNEEDLFSFASDLPKELCIISISCLLYTSPSPRDQRGSRMPSSA